MSGRTKIHEGNEQLNNADFSIMYARMFSQTQLQTLWTLAGW